MLDDDEAPPGPLEAEEPPPVPVLDDEPAVLPVPPLDGVLELELLDESAGALGADDDDEEEPPGTMTVSFSRVVVCVEAGAAVLPPGITVVSFFSQADNANAPTTANKSPLRLMFTLLSSG